MELGSWSVINLFGGAPSLLGMIPLIVFIVLSLKWTKNPVLACGVPALVGLLMAGQSAVDMGNAVMTSVSGFMGQIGIIVMLGSGLSRIMQESGVTTVLCHWIVKGFHINSKKKALLVMMITLLFVSFALGSNMTAAILAASLMVPIAARFGMNPAVTGFAMLIFTMCGAELSPFFSTNVTALELTGLSYGQLMVYSILPFVIVTCVAAFFTCLWLDKRLLKKSNGEQYTAADGAMDTTEVTREAKVTTIVFLVAFLAGVIYMMLFGGGFAFVFFYILGLSVVVSIVARKKSVEAVNSFMAGASGTFSIYIMLIFSDVMLATITAMGGFDALASALTGLVGDAMNETLLLIIASMFGVFGLNGTAAQQMLILEELFSPMYTAMGLSMVLWSMVLIFGSLISNFLFPGGMHVNYLGMGKSKDMRTMMTGCWIVCTVEILAAIIYSIVVPIFV